jgi:hypothetical protein
MNIMPTRDKNDLSGACTPTAKVNFAGWTFQLEQAVIIQFTLATIGTKHLWVDSFFQVSMNFN